MLYFCILAAHWLFAVGSEVFHRIRLSGGALLGGLFRGRIIHQGSSEGGRRQAQSPMMTSGARSCRSSAAETGPVWGPAWGPLSFCLRRPSLELDGGKRGMEEPLAVMTSGTSCCSSSSMPSCSASCRFTAMAWPAKNVRPRALLFLTSRR